MALDVGGVEAKLGATVDERGFREFDAAMARVDKAVAEAKATIKVDQPAFTRARREIEQTDKSVENLGDKIAHLSHGTSFLGALMADMKWEAAFLGAGLAAQLVGALTAGVVGLTAALAPLSGTLVAYPAMLGAFGQAMGTVALSGVNDLGAAVGGLNEELDTTSDEFKALTPRGQRFATFLDSLKPKILNLRESIQGPLFGGLEDGIEAAMKNMPAFRRVLTGTGEALGDVATNFGELVGSKAFGRDFEQIGEQNNQVLHRMGRFAVNVTSGFRHLLIAAEPLIDWMGRSAVKWSENFEAERKAGRQSGKTAEFFEETRKILERLVGIGSEVGEFFGDVGDAAQPLGNWILRNLNRELEHLTEWSDSTGGKVALAFFFEQAKEPLEAVWNLLEHVVKAIAHLAMGEELPRMLDLIGEKLVPTLEHLAEHALKVFSDPQMMENFAQFIELFGNLFGFTKPMEIFIDALGGIATVLNDIFKMSPEAHTMTVSLLGFYSVLATIGTIKGLHTLFGFGRGLEVVKKIPGVTTALGKLKDAFGLVSTKAGDALAIASAYAGDLARGISAKAGKVRTAIRNMLIRGALWTQAAATAVGEFVGGWLTSLRSSKLAQKLGEIFKAIGRRIAAVFAVSTAAGVVVGEGIGGAASSLPGRLEKALPPKFAALGRLVGGAFARAFLPIALAITTYFAAKDTIEDFADSGEGLIQGLIPGHQGGDGGGSETTSSTPGAPDYKMQPLRQKIMDLGGNYLKPDTVKEARKMLRDLRGETDRHLGGAADDADKHSKRLNKSVTDAAGDAQKAAQRAMRSIDSDSDKHLGRTAKTADKRSREFAGAIGGGASSASEAVYEGAQYIEKTVAKALKTLGADAPEFGLSKPRGKNAATGQTIGGTAGSSAYAGGGMIPGIGNRDTVPLVLGMAAPGEAILTKYQQQIVNMALGSTFGMGLGELFQRERRPHYFAAGGFVDPPGPGHGVVAPSIAGVVGKWSQAYNAAINYGYDPGGGHVSPGHNVTGTATDTSPAAGWTPAATALFEQGLRKLVAQGLTVGYGTAGIGEAWDNHGRGNHAHIEWGSAGGLNVGAVQMLKKLVVNGPDGALKTMAQRAIDKMRSAGNSKIKRAQAAMMAIDGPMGGGGPGSMGTSQFLSTAVRALRLTEHFPATMSNAQKLLILARQESGLNPNSINNWDSNAAAGNPSGGLMHTTESTFRAYHEPGTANSYFNPLASIAASINYQHDRYGGLVTHSPYARGGFLGGLSGLLNPNLSLNRRLARRRGKAILNGTGYDGRLGQAITFGAMVDQLRERGRRNALEDLLGTRRGRKYRSRVVGRMPGVFDRLTAAAQLAPGPTGGYLDHMMRRLNRAGLKGYARAGAASVRNTLAVSKAQRGVFGSGFAQGGFVGAPAGGGGMIPVVNVTPVFEGDARLLDLRVREVYVSQERETARRAGLARSTPSSTGRRARV